MTKVFANWLPTRDSSFNEWQLDRRFRTPIGVMSVLSSVKTYAFSNLYSINSNAWLFFAKFERLVLGWLAAWLVNRTIFKN